MAVKYTIPFYDDAGQNWRVDIDLPAYSDDPIELTGIGRVFCQPEWSAGSENPYEPIINSKVQIQFYNRSGEVDVQELQLLSDMEGRMIVYKGNDLWWTGYITPDGIQRMLQPNPYPITINATDGIALLKDVPFTFTEDWRLPVPASSYAPIGIIRYILYNANNLNIRIPLRFESGVISEVYSDNAMYGTMQWGANGEAWNYFDSENVKSCGEILENLLKAFQCRIFQFGGRWHIMRINDIVGGEYNWTEIAAETGNAPTVTTGTEDLTVDMLSEYSFVGENQVMTIRPALTDVTATYNQYQAENIVPNGNMDIWSSFGILYWGFESNPDGQLSYEQYEALDGRDGYSIKITHLNDGTIDEEGVFTFDGGLPFDANVLYKRMTFGFQFMPIEFPFNENEEVDWSTQPLKISIQYVLPDATYCLNEFGYWQSSARGTDLGVTFVRRESQYVPPPTEAYIHRMYFEGSPNIGDELILSIHPGMGGAYTDYSFVVTPSEEGNLGLALDGLEAALSGSATSNRSVNMTSATEGYIEFWQSGLFSPPPPKGSTRKSDAIQDFQHIYPTVDQLRRLDIASIQFQGKGGSSEILMPDPGELDGSQPTDVGKLYFKFHLQEGQSYVLDNVYIRVDDNHDVYKSSLPAGNKKTNGESVELGISSSFNGFYPSNIMTSYSESDREFVFSDGKYTGSLTGMTANAMMRFRHLASEVFSGSLHTNGNDWMFHHIYELNGKKLLPLSTKYNIEQCQIDVTAIECRDGDPVLVEQHYGSNDTILSDV